MAIAKFVERGGFLFAMCTATETLDLALAADGVDIAASYADGTPDGSRTRARSMKWDRALAFQNAQLELSPTMPVYSDIDGHQVNSPDRRQPLGSFTLFNFSAKIDPVATMLVQNHRQVIPDFYGLTTSLHPEDAQAQRHGAGRGAGRALGQVHPRRARAGHLDLLRRARSGRPAAPDRRRADRSVAASALAGIPADPEQRALPGGQEERAQDLSERIAPGVRAYLAERDRRRGRPGGLLRGPGRSRRRDHRRAGGGPGHGGHGARAARRGRRGARCCCTTIPAAVLDPSGADLNVAARLHDAGVGFGILNNEATELYVVVEVPRDRAGRADRSRSTSSTPWARRGRSPAQLSQYEDRRSQRDMAAHIADGYNDGGVQLLEAGTGVGKSFAYLVPALAWARANGERTVVSTNTINLQEQLVGKDLPLLREALGDGGLLRPRSRCSRAGGTISAWPACTRRWLAQRTLLEQDKLDELIGIAEWAGHTADGTLSDLPVTPSPEVWDEVSAEPDLCTRLKCPHFDRCFLFRARRRAAEADVVVVNHHLLAADLLGAPGAGQLAGGRGAAAVPAADPRRGAPSRGCRRQSSRHPGHAAGRCGGCSTGSSGTAGAWLRPWRTSCRAGTIC